MGCYINEITAQRYDRLGVRQGNEFQVNTTVRPVFSSDVALDDDGDFAIVWASRIGITRPSNTLDYDIFGQRYSRAEVTQGSEFRVNTFTPSTQFNPAIAMDADGDFVVTWASRYEDGTLGTYYGNGYGIFGQRFAGAGSGVNVTCNGLTATLVGTSGNDTLIGTSGDDVIAGLGGDDILIGLSGNDTLCAGAGNDLLLGGFGNDALIGGPHDDTALFGGNAGVSGNLTTGTARGEGNDTLREIGNVIGTAAADNITGNGQKNLLIGRQGNDVLNGLGGDDTLLGGEANDTLNGGAGVDMCNGQDGSADSANSCETVQNVP